MLLPESSFMKYIPIDSRMKLQGLDISRHMKRYPISDLQSSHRMRRYAGIALFTPRRGFLYYGFNAAAPDSRLSPMVVVKILPENELIPTYHPTQGQ